jgi:HJR/Mrr/RecB family endonuclease
LLKKWSGEETAEAGAHEDTTDSSSRKDTAESADSSSLDEMTPAEFEVYVKSYFERLGYTASVTPLSNDRGVDVWLAKDEIRGAVQCKHKSFGYKVGSPEVQALIGAAVTEGADFAYIVTNQDFTENALEAIKRCSKVKVIAIGRAQLTAEGSK